MVMRDHTSPSQVTSFFDCPLRWYFRNEGYKSPPPAFVHSGTGTHGGVALDLTHKIETGDLLTLDEVQDAVRDATNKAFDEKGVSLTKEEKERGEKNIRGEAVDQAVAMTSHHHVKLAPTIDPAAVEMKAELEIPGYPKILMYLDIVERSTNIRETKTIGRTPSEIKNNHIIQIDLYGLFQWKMAGRFPQAMVDYLVRTKKPKHISYPHQVNMDGIRRVVTLIEVMEEAIEKGIFVPRLTAPYPHSEKYCGYWNICRFGGGTKGV